MSKDNKKSALEEMQEMQTIILKKIENLNELNNEYKDKQEKHFLKTFIHVMDRISNQLLIAQEKYINIDKEVQKDQKCIKLATQLKFFRQECLQLRKQLKQTRQQLAQEKKRKSSLLKEKQAMSESLVRKSKQAFKYRAKFLNFSKEIQSEDIMPKKKEFRSSKKRTFRINPQETISIEKKQLFEEDRSKLHSSDFKSPIRDQKSEQMTGKNLPKYRNSLISTSHGLDQGKKRKIYF